MAVIGRTNTHDLHPGDSRPDLNYVPALDGVRGVAVLAIMGYHGGVLLTRGGFYSLDAFFALSGFLITSLLVAEWQKSGSIRLGRFWARRARRLLPALFLLLLVVLAYATWIAPPGMYPELRGDSLSTLFYVANWHFIVTGSNYFVQTGATSPLLHTWSLAVEEQFYLVWPLVVLLILRSRLGLRFLFAVCVSGAIGSALLMGILASPSTQNRVVLRNRHPCTVIVDWRGTLGWVDDRSQSSTFGRSCRDRGHHEQPGCVASNERSQESGVRDRGHRRSSGNRHLVDDGCVQRRLRLQGRVLSGSLRNRLRAGQHRRLAYVDRSEMPRVARC